MDLDFILPKSEMDDLGFETSEETVDTSIETPQETTVSKEPIAPSTTSVVENKEDLENETEDSTNLESHTDLEAYLEALGKEGFIQELPEGIESVEDMEAFDKVLKHNLGIQKQTSFEEGKNFVLGELDKCDDFVKNIMQFNLNGEVDSSEILNYAKSLLYQSDITNLDPVNAVDQEEIIRTYYKEIKKLDATDFNLMWDAIKDNPELRQKRAEEVKPKLDEQAKLVAQRQVEEQRRLVEFEANQKKTLESRVLPILNKGIISDIPITEEERQKLHAVMFGGKAEFNIGKKKMSMEQTEYLTFFHKYSENGDPQLLMEAMLLLIDPKKVRGHYAKVGNKTAIAEVKKGLLFNKGIPQPTTKTSKASEEFKNI